MKSLKLACMSIATCVSLFVIGCSKEETEPNISAQYSTNALYRCHNNSNWEDAFDVRIALNGQWEGRYASCFSYGGSSEESFRYDSIGFDANFLSRDSVLVEEQETGKVSTHYYEIIIGSPPSSDLKTIFIRTLPRVDWFNGYVYLCEDRIVFDHPRPRFCEFGLEKVD